MSNATEWEVRRTWDYGTERDHGAGVFFPSSGYADKPPKGLGWEPFAAGVIFDDVSGAVRVLSWTAWRRPTTPFAEE